MRNKRAQIFAGYLVLLTVFLCFLSISFYFIQQKNVENSIVSPKAVMEARDELGIFEMRERELILDSLEDVRGGYTSGFSKDDFSDYSFLVSFRNKFLEKLKGNEEMREFIFNDLVVEGRSVSEIELDRESFLSNYLYGDFKLEGDSIVLKRGDILKSKSLFAKDTSKINFQTTFGFEIEREYLISFDDFEFEVKVRE